MITLSTTEAAELIGCSNSQVRWLIRNGLLRAAKRKTKDNQFGYEYAIPYKEAERVRDTKKTGRPRGPNKPRKKAG